MIKQNSITSIQLLLILIGSRLMLTYTFMPVISAPPGNQDSWIVAALTPAYLMILALPILYLVNRFKGKTAVEITEIILGRFVGKIVVAIFIMLAIFCFGSCVNMDVVFLNSAIFPETPPWALLLYILIPVGYAAYKEIGAIGRTAAFIVPYIILTIVFFLLLGIRDIDLDVLKPVFVDSSLLELNYGAVMNAMIQSEVILVFVLAVFLSNKTHLNRIFATEVLFGTALVLLMVIPTLGILGIYIAQAAWNPYFLYTKQVTIYDFIQRVESLNVLAWFLGSLLRSSVFCFVTSHLLSRTMKLKNDHLFVIPLCLVVFFVIQIPALANSSTLLYLISYDVLPWIVSPVVSGIPLLMAIVYGIRSRLGKRILSGEIK